MTPKSAPTATGNVELYKTANAQASFICEAMLGLVAEDGNVYNKVVLVIVKRDKCDKALQTVRYFLDIAPAKVLCHDLWDGTLYDEHNEFKRRSHVQRVLKIEPQDTGGYRFSIMNDDNGDKAWLFFDLNRFQARCLARQVLDYVSNYELASMIYSLRK